jgi:hypothetical protein
MKGAQNHSAGDIDHDWRSGQHSRGGRDQGGGQPGFLFTNSIRQKNAWVAVRLHGDGQLVNRDTIRAKVTVEVGGHQGRA